MAKKMSTSKAKNMQNVYLYDINGKVDTILSKHKAVISFNNKSREERALVLYDKVKVNGVELPEGSGLGDFLEEGLPVKFSGHTFDETGHDRCGWFVTQISHKMISKQFPHLGLNENTMKGLFNMTGTIKELAKRQGVLVFKSETGMYESVLFLGSKLFIYGNRVKASLKGHIHLEEGTTQLNFDAVPCDEEENERGCQWFATVVWLGPKKPIMDYDSSDKQLQPKDFLSKIKTVAFNPRGVFVCGQGQILEILNAEYGLALGMIKPNHWQSILFHRSMCFLFKVNLSARDLTKVFKEGDKIKFIAVPAPKKYIAQLIATQIGIYVHPSISAKYKSKD